MLASLLALLASLSWGTADFWAGLEARRTNVWTAALIGQGVAALVLVATLLVLSPETPPAAALVPAVIGGVMGAAGALLQYRALAILDMSVASLIVAGAALVPVAWGLARGEQPGALQVAGVVMTLVGIVLISRGPSSGEVASRRVDRAGVLVAVGSAVTLGLFLVAVDYGEEAGPLWTVTVVRMVALIVLALAAAAARPRVRPRGRALPILLVVGLLIATANISFASDDDDGLSEHRRGARLAEPCHHHPVGPGRPARTLAPAAGCSGPARVRGDRLHHAGVGRPLVVHLADGERHLSTNKTARYVAHNTVFMARLLRANPIPTNLKRIMEDAQAVSDV